MWDFRVVPSIRLIGAVRFNFQDFLDNFQRNLLESYFGFGHDCRLSNLANDTRPQVIRVISFGLLVVRSSQVLKGLTQPLVRKRPMVVV